MKRFLTLVLTGCILATACTAAAEDKDVATAKKLLKDYANAVVHISAVVTMTPEGQLAGRVRPQERKIIVIGTAIDPSGLAVTALSSLDPSQSSVQMLLAGGRLKFKTEFGEVKFRYADGTEVPARIVMKDEDLDLAFIAPADKLDDKTKKKFATVKLADAQKKAELLDRLILIGRVGKSFGYVPAVSMTRVSAVVTKPRTVYLAPCAPGQPAFTGNGKLLGMCVARRSAGSRGRAPVILPAADIAEIAEQAKEEMEKVPAAI